MEKLKIYYIICFIFQVISMPLLVLLLYLMSITVIYQDLYCDIVDRKSMIILRKNLKKYFQMNIYVRILHLQEWDYI